MAISEIQREQIILRARQNATLKASDIAAQFEITPMQASAIIYRAKKKLGESFYLNGQKKPTDNCMLVFGCLERTPRVPVTIKSVMRKTGLAFDQVKTGARTLRRNHGKCIELHGQLEQAYLIYNPSGSEPRELVRKLTMPDVFNMMNQLEIGKCE